MQGNDDDKPKRIHELKTWPEPFQALVDGRKTFEYRKDDRGFAVGDELLLQEWDPAKPKRFLGDYGGGTIHGDYTGRKAVATITYRLGSEFGVPEGYCVLSVAGVRLLEGKDG